MLTISTSLGFALENSTQPRNTFRIITPAKPTDWRVDLKMYHFVTLSPEHRSGSRHSLLDLFHTRCGKWENVAETNNGILTETDSKKSLELQSLQNSKRSKLKESQIAARASSVLNEERDSSTPSIVKTPIPKCLSYVRRTLRP